MNKLIRLIFCASCLLGLSFVQLKAQNVATAQVSATIIIPITATEISPLSFGRFFPGDQGGTIVISPNGSVVTSASVVAAASARNPGVFQVSGEMDATFSISLPTGPATLTDSEGNSTMVVSDWVSLPASSESGIKLSGGSQAIMIGATLRVGSLNENPKGLYSGTYQITFAYN